jgi:hypothetical protein
MINLGGYFLGNIVTSLVDEGISNLLGVEILRHGTNPVNYASIKIYGGDPNHGGKKSGSTIGWSEDPETKNHFYFFKNSEIYNFLPSNTIKEKFAHFLMCPALNYCVRIHSFLSGYNFAAGFVPKFKIVPSVVTEATKKIMGIYGGILSTCFTPTLRFHYSRINPNIHENDPAYGGAAYRTSYKVEAWRIGILGALLTGVNTGWPSRFKANPTKILTGAVQLIAAAALINLTITLIAANAALMLPLTVGIIVS